MKIHASTKAVPYVYMCVHRETKEFYIGYRYKNTISSNEDLPKYKTSSKKVKPLFDKFEWFILAEFFTDSKEEDAYDFEQRLIYEHWNNPLLLNKTCFHSSHKRFRQPKVLSDVSRKKMSLAHKGREVSCETRKKLSIANSLENNAMFGKITWMKGKTHTPEVRAKISDYAKNRILSEETKRKLSVINKGKVISEEQRDRIRESNSTRNISAATREKMSESAKNVSAESRKQMSNTKKNAARIQCPHCSKIGGPSAMKQWHFDNCRDKEQK